MKLDVFGEQRKEKYEKLYHKSENDWNKSILLSHV